MPEVVSDTSPLQYLHQTALLHLLRLLYGKVTVPAAVAGEIEHGRSLGLVLPDLTTLPWITVQEIRQPPAPIAMKELGAGETETLALGMNLPGSLLLLDDRLAHQRAKLLGLRFTGTLGVLIKAKQVGFLQAVRPVLNRLVTLGFRIDGGTSASVLRLAGELLA